jgi:hypothetical protein
LSNYKILLIYIGQRPTCGILKDLRVSILALGITGRRPDIYAIAIMYEYIGRIGGNTTAIYWIGSLDDGWTWTEKDCIESDWQNDDVHIEGYDAASLEKSCHEVVKSSTWIHSASEMIEESLE